MFFSVEYTYFFKLYCENFGWRAKKSVTKARSLSARSMAVDEKTLNYLHVKSIF